MTTSPFEMSASSDLEQQKNPQVHQTSAVAGNEHGQMTQDETTLYVAGTLEVRLDLPNSNLPSLLLFFFLLYGKPMMHKSPIPMLTC